MGAVYAVIPVKRLSEGKTRLSHILDADSRARLVLAMLEDILTSIRMSRYLVGAVVVSPSREAIELASGKGFWGIMEEPALGLNHAVGMGIDAVQEVGADAALVLPVDIPLVEPSDLDELVSIGLEMEGPYLVIAPSEDGGTNALMLSLPPPLRPRFGPGSFRAHVEEAERLGVRFKIFRCRRISLDLDDERDLRQIVAAGKENRSLAYLKLVLGDRIP